MHKNMRWVREEFENNLKTGLRKFQTNFLNPESLSSSAQNMQEGSTHLQWQEEVPVSRDLLNYSSKLIIAALVVYFLFTSIVSNLVETVGDAASARKVAVRDWVHLSMRKHGIVYYSVEMLGKPELTFSLAKYYERIGDYQTAIELTQMALRLNEEQTKEQRQTEYNNYLKRLTGDSN